MARPIPHRRTAQLSPPAALRDERRVLAWGLAFTALAGLLGQLPLSGVDNTSPLSLDGERMLAATWNAALLAGAAVTAFAARATLPTRALALFGGVLAYMAVDEWFEIHERLEASTGIDWMVIMLPVGLVAAAAGLGVLWRLRAAGHVKAALLVACGGVAWLVSQVLEDMQWEGDRRVEGYRWLVTAEEMLEMGGALLFIVALLPLARRRWRA